MNIQIYSTPQCPFCVRAKTLLQEIKLAYEELDASIEANMHEMISRTGNRTVPKIFIDGNSAGGFC